MSKALRLLEEEIKDTDNVADVRQLYVIAIASELIFNDCPIIYVYEIKIIMFVLSVESLWFLEITSFMSIY